MAEDRIDSIIDVAAIQAELDVTEKGIADLVALIKSVKGAAIGVTDAKGSGDYTKKAKELSTIMTNIEQQYKAVQNLLNQRFATEAKLATLQTDYAKQTARNTEEIKKTNKELRTQAAYEAAAPNSLERVRALRAKIRQEVDKTNLADGERIAQLNDRIDKLTAIEKKFTDRQRQQSLNVGNYEGSAKIIVDALKSVEDQISRLQAKQKELQNLSTSNPIGFKLGGHDDELKQVNAELKGAVDQFAALDKITTDSKFIKVAGAAGDAKKEIGFMVGRLNELETAGLKDTKVYAELEKRIASLKDQLADTNQRLKALASDTRGFDLFASSVSFAADTFKTASGAAILFGASEKAVAEQIKTLIAVQNVSSGIQSVANQLTTEGTAANKIKVKLQNLLTTATNGTATAQARLNAVLKLSGIALLVTGVALLAANFNKLKNFLFGTNKEAERLAETNKRLGDFNNDVSASVAKESSALVILKAKIEDTKIPMQTRIANVKDLQLLYPQYFKDLKQEDILNGNAATAYDQAAAAILRKAKALAANKKIEELSQKDLDIDKAAEEDKKLTDEKIKNAKDVFETIQQGQDTRLKKSRIQVKQDLVQGFKDREEDRKKEREAIKKEQDFYLGTIRKNTDETDEQRKRREDEEQKAREEKEKRDKEAADKNKKLAEDAAKHAKEIRERNAAAQLGIDLLELKQHEEFYKDILDNEKMSYTERLYALGRYNEYRQAAIVRQAQYELSKAGLTAKETELIARTANDAINKIHEEGVKQRLEFFEQIRKGLTEGEKDLQDALIKIAEDGYKKWKEIQDKKAKDRKEKDEDDKKAAEDLAKAKLDLEAQLVSELTTLSFTFLTAGIERQKNALQTQLDNIEIQKAREIELADGNADAIAAIEARAQVQKEAIQRKQRELDIKKAQFEKAQAIARIIQETAIAIVSSLKNPTLIPLIIAIGAAQLAQVIATPIPRYKDGGKHGGGPMIVGDGGRAEGIVFPDGTTMKSPATSTLMDAPAGTVIHKDFNKMMFNSTMTKPVEYKKAAVTDSNLKVVKGLKAVEKAIGKIPQPTFVLHNVLKQRVRHGHAVNDHIKRNLGK